MNLFKKKYRIVKDNYSGYAAQWRWWFFPVWFECFNVNTHYTEDEAINECWRHAYKKDVGYLP